jgi:hypothetical protein
MNEKTMVRADFVSSLFLLVFGAYVVYDSWRMPRFEEQKANVWSSPGLVPGILGLLFMLTGAIMLVRSLRKGGHHLNLTRAVLVEALRQRTTQSFLVTLALGLLYGAGMMGHLPYPVATALFVFVFIYIAEFKRGRPIKAEARSIGIAAAIAVITSVVVTFVFQNLFLVNLP